MRSRNKVVLAVGAALLATAAAAGPVLAQVGGEPSGGSRGQTPGAASARTAMMATGTGEQPGTPANPGMARMHQQMTQADPGTAAAHEAMTRQSPQMARVHEQMMGAASSSSPAPQ